MVTEFSGFNRILRFFSTVFKIALTEPTLFLGN
jgi:hypothetical protein